MRIRKTITETENILKVIGFMVLLLKITKKQSKKKSFILILKLSREKVDLKILLWLSTFICNINFLKKLNFQMKAKENLVLKYLEHTLFGNH